jgi:hypothetical protein
MASSCTLEAAYLEKEFQKEEETRKGRGGVGKQN